MTREIEAAFKRLESTLGRSATDEELAAELGTSVEALGKLLSDVRGTRIGLKRKEAIEDAIQFLVDPSAPDPYVQVEREELKRHLAHAINGLPERERMAVTLYYHEELTMKEVGELLGVNESRVSQIHSKAVLRLRAKLCLLLGKSEPSARAQGEPSESRSERGAPRIEKEPESKDESKGKAAPPRRARTSAGRSVFTGRRK